MSTRYIFESERLGFRRWQESDKEAFAAMNADAAVMKYFPNLLTREESDLLLAKFEHHFVEKGYGIWAVDIKASRQFIGFIGLLEVNMAVDFKKSTEIGWRLAQAYWKKGYAVEGAMACLNYAFNSLKMEEIYAFTSILNKPSETVMQRIGMDKIGEFNHPNLEGESPLQRHVLYKIKGVETSH